MPYLTNYRNFTGCDSDTSKNDHLLDFLIHITFFFPLTPTPSRTSILPSLLILTYWRVRADHSGRKKRKKKTPRSSSKRIGARAAGQRARASENSSRLELEGRGPLPYFLTTAEHPSISCYLFIFIAHVSHCWPVLIKLINRAFFPHMIKFQNKCFKFTFTLEIYKH